MPPMGSLTLPSVGGSTGTWGTTLNAALNALRDGVNTTGGNQYSITGLAANGSDEGTALNAALAASPVGYTVILPKGVIGTSIPIRFPAGREYVGAGWNYGYAGTVIRQVNGSAITTALAGSEGYFTNVTTSEQPTVIRNICFDVNGPNCPSSTAHGVVLLGFWSRIEDCLVYNAKGDGIRVTDTPQNGTPITNSSSENIVRGCRVDVAAGAGIRGLSNAFAGPLDGFIENNLIKDCLYGILVNRAAGWRITGNHLYGIAENGIDCDGGFATRITDNYIEDLGGNGATGTRFYVGIQLKLYDGYGSIVANNTIGTTQADSGSSYYGIVVQSQTGQSGSEATVTGNVCNGGGGSNGAGMGLWGGGGVLHVIETANLIRGFPQRVDLDSTGVYLALDAAQPKQAALSGRGVMLVEGICGTATPTTLGIVPTAIGTATSATWGTGNALASVQRVSYVSAGTAGSSGGVRGPSTAPVWRGNAAGLGGFTVVIRFGLATIPATRRWFVGLALNAPTNADPSSFTSIIGVGQDVADTNIQFMHNDTTGTATKTSTGLASIAAGEIWEARVQAPVNGGKVTIAIGRVAGTNSYAEYNTGASTDLPAATAALFPVLWANNGSTASLIDPHLIRMYVETPL